MVVTLGNKTDDTLLTCLLLLLGGEQLQEGELLGGQASEHEGGGGDGQGGAGGRGQAEAGGGGEAGRGDRVQEEDRLRGGHGHQADGDSQSDQALQICTYIPKSSRYLMYRCQLNPGVLFFKTSFFMGLY